MEFHKGNETMESQACCCGKKSSELDCTSCASGEPLLYWCATCLRQVAEKRCPGCGLKTSKRSRRDYM